MNLTRPQYLQQLNAAKTLHYLDWDGEALKGYTKVVGKLEVRLQYDTTTGDWNWTLNTTGGRQLYAGSSESASLAQLEALAYAENYVKHAETLIPA